jgi:hypothetical protein
MPVGWPLRVCKGVPPATKACPMPSCMPLPPVWAATMTVTADVSDDE